MISFKNFLNESQWMYHGSTDKNIESLKPDRDHMVLDRAIGSHFAADPEISKKFASGLYKDKTEGSVYKTKSLKRSELHVIHQKRYKHGALESDQNAIGSHVISTVLGHPDNKEMFKSWVKHARGVNDETAEAVHDHLSKGKAPADSKKFGLAATKRNNSFKSYISNFDSGLNMQPEPDFKKKVVSKYLDIMKSRGKKGLVYQNTSPMEKEGARSTKNYIVFEPENLKLEKHEETN
jgi:hypothetical protein